MIGIDELIIAILSGAIGGFVAQTLFVTFKYIKRKFKNAKL